MSDYAHNETDKTLEALEKQIASVYKQASKDMSKTVTNYFKQFAKRDSEEQDRLAAGEITKETYTQWRLDQIGRGGRYTQMRDQLAERYTNANEVAVAYVNDATPGIYSLNRNYAAYTIEQVGGDVGFTMWDEQTVKRLIVEQPNLMPYYPEAKAIKRGIDLAYGKQQITAAVTSGILQGESVYKIADDLMNRITTMSMESAIRTARTAVTEAENAGRQDTYEAAEEMGIEMEKEWVATLDDVTRETHQQADGQVVDYDEPFQVGDDELMYPGDSSGSPEEIYNCRCTMIARVKDVDMSDATRWSEDGPVDNMTYEEWLESKEDEGETAEEVYIEQPEEQTTEADDNLLERILEEDAGRDYEELLNGIDISTEQGYDQAEDEWYELTSPNVTDEQWEKINEGYVGTRESYDINEALRENPDKSPEEILKGDQLETVQALEKAIENNQLQSDTQLTRYVYEDVLQDMFGIDQNTFNEIVGDLTTDQIQTDVLDSFIGSTITENGIVSTSGNSYLNQFKFDCNVRLDISAPSGTNALITDNFAESEVILGRGTQYIITGFEKYVIDPNYPIESYGYGLAIKVRIVE